MKTRKIALVGTIATMSMVAVPFAGVAAASQAAAHPVHNSVDIRHGDPRSQIRETSLDHRSSRDVASSRDRGSSRDRTPSPDRASSAPER